MVPAAPKPPLAIHPCGKLWGILAFSHKARILHSIRRTLSLAKDAFTFQSLRE